MLGADGEEMEPSAQRFFAGSALKTEPSTCAPAV